MVLHDTFPDFILFLYVHMSQADQRYDPQELALIKSKMRKLYPTDTDLEKKLYNTIRQYKSFDPSHLKILIQDSLARFKDEGTASQSIYTDLYDIIRADGQLLQSETSSLETLRRIIDHQVSSNG